MHITRRQFVESVAATGAALAVPGRLMAKAPVDERMILSSPLTYADWIVFRPGTAAWGDEGVRHALDACKACGWSHVYWRVFDAGRATYPSKLRLAHMHPEADCYFSPQTDADRQVVRAVDPSLTPERSAEILKQLEPIDYAAFDSLAAAVEYGHGIGLKIHAWASLNEEDHAWGWPSEFSKAHPEYRWVRRDGRVYHSQLSFAFPEVRQYMLGLMEEILAYDVDGLFLDWIRTGDVRDNPQTDPAGVADNGYERPNIDAFQAEFGVDPQEVANDDDRWVRVRAQPQTDFMRDLRKLVNGRSQQTAICALTAHPWHLRGHDPIDGNLRGLLLDVKTWADEGLIDAAIAAGYYRAGGSAESAYQALVTETGGKIDVWYYAGVPNSISEFTNDFNAAHKLGAERMLFWEADYIDGRPNAAELKAAMAAKALW